ncbi:hypothetical protein DH2020_015933 [Rehmannia glutinosa]|uniref:Uncharacterized protein n=1 Tax=Rehmannia glutinosa TaxID=99300 RepID=A0ABR0WVL9_REHGL
MNNLDIVMFKILKAARVRFSDVLVEYFLSFVNLILIRWIGDLKHESGKLLNVVSNVVEHDTLMATIWMIIKSPEKGTRIPMICRHNLKNLRQGHLKESLAGKPPSNIEELLSRAEKHIRVEESTKPEPGSWDLPKVVSQLDSPKQKYYYCIRLPKFPPDAPLVREWAWECPFHSNLILSLLPG